jgi:hypothetical protein
MKSDRIKNWPKEERPRERLLAEGAGNLTEAELLAIILRVGQGTFKEGITSLNLLFQLTGAELDPHGDLLDDRTALHEAKIESIRDAFSMRCQRGKTGAVKKKPGLSALPQDYCIPELGAKARCFPSPRRARVLRHWSAAGAHGATSGGPSICI